MTPQEFAERVRERFSTGDYEAVLALADEHGAHVLPGLDPERFGQVNSLLTMAETAIEARRLARPRPAHMGRDAAAVAG